MHDLDLEADVLAMCLRDSKYVKAAQATLDARHFASREHGWVWRVISETHRASKEIPSATIFFARADLDFTSAEAREAAIDTVIALAERTVDAPEAALDLIRKMTRMALIRSLGEQSLTGIDLGDLDKAEASVHEGLAALRAVGQIEPVRPLAEAAEQRLARRLSPERGIVRFRTPFPTVNGWLRGGLKAGHIGVLLGNTNAGKTSLATDLGGTALIHDNAAVLHIVTEEILEDSELRYDARLSGVERDVLEDGRLSDAQVAAYRGAYAQPWAQRLHLNSVPPGSPVTAIEPLVEEVRSKHPGIPLLVVFDSPWHVHWIKNVGEFRHEVRYVFEYLLAMVQSKEFAPIGMWCTDHARRQDAGRTPGAESGGESYDKNRAVSLVFGLREIAATDHTGEAVVELHLAKNRISKAKKKVLITRANHGLCSFRESPLHGTFDEAHGAEEDDDD